jgi:hypothetical protein
MKNPIAQLKLARLHRREFREPLKSSTDSPITCFAYGEVEGAEFYAGTLWSSETKPAVDLYWSSEPVRSSSWVCHDNGDIYGEIGDQK